LVSAIKRSVIGVARFKDTGSATAELVILLPIVSVVISVLAAITYGQIQLLHTLQAGQQVARALQLGVGEGAAGALASNLGITYSMAGQNPITADSNVRCLLTRTVASGPFGLMLPAQRVCFLQVGE
jgi:hypothetical protein